MPSDDIRLSVTLTTMTTTLLMAFYPEEPRLAGTRKTLTLSVPIFVGVIQCLQLISYIYCSP